MSIFDPESLMFEVTRQLKPWEDWFYSKSLKEQQEILDDLNAQAALPPTEEELASQRRWDAIADQFAKVIAEEEDRIIGGVVKSG